LVLMTLVVWFPLGVQRKKETAVICEMKETGICFSRS
jgi:hypothetical protein